MHHQIQIKIIEDNPTEFIFELHDPLLKRWVANQDLSNKDLFGGCLVLSIFPLSISIWVWFTTWGVALATVGLLYAFFRKTDQQKIIVTPKELVLFHSLPLLPKKYITAKSINRLYWDSKKSNMYAELSYKKKPIRLFKLNGFNVDEVAQKLIDKTMLVLGNPIIESDL